MTATHQPLFFAAPDPHALFEKVAAVAKMTDDEKKWPAQIISELMRQLPYLSKYSVDLDLSRIEPEAGYGLGYAMVVNKSLKNSPTDQISQPKNRIRIPVVIKERMLQPFHVFEVGGTVYPLTEDRINAAMFNPDTFDGVADKVPVSPSLIDQLYPPYQQRQGFGRVGGDSDLPAMGKSGSAPDFLGNAHAQFWRKEEAPLVRHHAKLYAKKLGKGPHELDRDDWDEVEESFLRDPKIASAPASIERYFASAGRMKKEAETQKEALSASLVRKAEKAATKKQLVAQFLSKKIPDATKAEGKARAQAENFRQYLRTEGGWASREGEKHLGRKAFPYGFSSSTKKTASLRDFAIERGFLKGV